MENSVTEVPKALSNIITRGFYSDAYKNTVFYIWYITGKPTCNRLRQLIPVNIDNDIPGEDALRVWVRDFRERAVEIDELVDKELKEATVKEKVAMLEKHAETAMEMQDIAIVYLREHKESLNPHSAVRLLVDGIRIERESRGLSSMLLDISKASDDDLMDMLEKMMDNLDITPEELEAGDIDKDE